MDIGAIITSVGGIIGTSSIISALILKRIDKLEKMLDKREDDRIRENIVRGETLHAVGQLAQSNTVALRAITSDEVCSLELSNYREAADNLERFIREKTAEYLHAN